MRRLRARLLPALVATLLCGGVARAQDAGAAGAAPPAPTSSPSPDPADLDRAYAEAFQRLVAGNGASAAAALDRIAVESADPVRRGTARELARFARGIAGSRAAPEAGVTFVSAPPLPAPAEADNSGRIEVIVQAANLGLGAGATLAVNLIDSYQGPRVPVALVVGGGLAGALGGIYGTRPYRISAGAGQSMTTGMVLALGNTLLLAGPLGFYDSNTPKGLVNFGFSTIAGGGALGLTLGQRLRPTQGQAMFVYSAGAISMLSTLALIGIVHPSSSDLNTLLTILAVALDTGAVAGGVLAPRLDWSPSRVRLINLSGFLGALAGGAIAGVILSNNGGDTSKRVGVGLVLAGGWTGLWLGHGLTDELGPDPAWRRRESAETALVPFVTRDAAGLGLAGRF